MIFFFLETWTSFIELHLVGPNYKFIWLQWLDEIEELFVSQLKTTCYQLYFCKFKVHNKDTLNLHLC